MLAALIVIGVFECIRARVFISDVQDYKNSAAVLTIVDSVDRLTRSVDSAPPVYYCQLNYVGLISKFNPAYDELAATKDLSEELVPKLNQDLVNVEPVPAYSSLLEFLPQPKKARKISQDLHASIDSLKQLTSADARTSYCLTLRDALAKVYFLQDLRNPEGVSALSVGQLESFQVNVSQAQAIIQPIEFPTIFEAEHVAFLQLLQKIAIDLREDEDKYTQFSRSIEQDVLELEEILAGLREASGDLLNRPKDIALQASYLQIEP